MKIRNIKSKVMDSENEVIRSHVARGFTLIELLLVVTVIAILAALLLPAVNRVRDGARERQAQTEARIIGQAIAAYRLQHRRFPAPEHHLENAGQDMMYGEDGSGGNNAAVMRILRDADPPVLDAGSLRWEGDNVVNPWGRQYNITLDLNYDGRVAGRAGDYHVGTNIPDYDDEDED